MLLLRGEVQNYEGQTCKIMFANELFVDEVL